MNTGLGSVDLEGAAVVATSRGTVGALMSRPLVTIDHTATLRRAAEELAGDGIGALVVLHGEALIGVLSERDVVAHVAMGADLDHLSVGEVMQVDVVTTTADASAWDAARTMVRADVRHLPVLVGHRVEGMVSVRDLMAALCEERDEGNER